MTNVSACGANCKFFTLWGTIFAQMLGLLTTTLCQSCVLFRRRQSLPIFFDPPLLIVFRCGPPHFAKLAAQLKAEDKSL